jgi:hypothetical protein
MPKKSSDWVTTKKLADELGCNPKLIRNTLKDSVFREGRKREYINLNPTAWRPTYRWHLERCLKRYDVAGS